MQFYSLQSIVFLIVIFIIYWIIPKRYFKIQNILLLLANYGFYALWDWRFLSLVVLITLLNYLIGNAISNSVHASTRKLYLVINIIVHISLIGFFRYYNFFIGSLIKSFSLFGVSISINFMKIILPLGISIFTLQGLSYTFDIFRQKLQPSKDIIAFFAYVSFFPQIIIGPIERATSLLPQFFRERIFCFENLESAMRRILWGIFKITVIANNCAIYSNEVFANYSDYSGFTIFVGLLFFVFQLYTDFSGLTDIATGIAKLFGFDLGPNFKFPFFSRNIADFWTKWNISLMAWIKEYVYYPMGGTNGTLWLKFRNLFVLFLLIALWHGGNGLFIVFAFVNAIFVLPNVLRTNIFKVPLRDKSKVFSGFFEVFRYLFTFILILVGFTFFGAETINDAKHIIQHLFTNFFYVSILELRSLGNSFALTLSHSVILIIYVIFEWVYREKNYALDFDNNKSSNQTKWMLTGFILILVLFFNGPAQDDQFFLI